MERASFPTMDKAEMRLGQHKGKFSVLRLYANPVIRAKYPIHCILALVVYGAAQNEADCERVFAFSGATLSDQRASLSALVLEAFVMVGINIDNFVIDDHFYLDVRKEYDTLRHKMGIPHHTDVADDEAPQEEEDDDEDGARTGAGGDAAAAAAAADIAVA